MAKNKKTIIDREQDALFAEVWDDVRQQKTIDLFKKYGKFIIGTVVVILVLVAGNQFMMRHKAKSIMSEAEQYASAMNQNLFTSAAKAEEAFIKLAEDGQYGYQALSYFNRANEMMKQNKKDDAIIILKEAVKNIKVKEMRHMAILKLALLEMDTLSAVKAKNLMEPLMSEDSPFYFTSLYLMGMIYVKEDSSEEAKSMFEKVIKHDDAPQELRIASSDMVGFLSAQ